MQPTEQGCTKCFFAAEISAPLQIQRKHVCRHSPPQVIATPGQAVGQLVVRSIWPPVSKDDWCHQWHDAKCPGCSICRPPTRLGLPEPGEA